MLNVKVPSPRRNVDQLEMVETIRHHGERDVPFMYRLPSLDSDWYPILEGQLKGGARPLRRFSDEPDEGLFLQHQERPSSIADDIDARGVIDARELERDLRRLSRRELEGNLGISWNKIREIIRRADVNRTGEIDYRTFLETVQRYRLTTEQESTLKSLVGAFAFAEEFTCWPPTVCMISLTLFEMVFFIYHALHLPSAHGIEVTWDGPVPYCSVLIYNPYRRWEVWRYLSYMLVHIGIGHFVFNMIMQILVGVFLEMQQEGWIGSLRVLAVYLSGVLAGSLGTSLSDPRTYIAGASGGVYALIFAHLATLVLNWQEDSAIRIKKVIHRPLTRTVRLIFISFLTVHDVALAIYVRFFSRVENRTGFMGHFCGALAGLLVGVFILDNRRVRTWEPLVQWISLSIFAMLLTFAIMWNIWGNSWTESQFFPVPNYDFYNDESGNCKHYEYI